jgi:hypothetical protein
MSMREWLDQLTDYLEKKESLKSSPLSRDLSKIERETEVLLDSAEKLEAAYSQLIEELDHVGR